MNPTQDAYAGPLVQSASDGSAPTAPQLAYTGRPLLDVLIAGLTLVAFGGAFLAITRKGWHE
jgi:hypothetical protein